MPNVNLFLSFHVVQNMHKGVACQAFLWALPTNDPCHPRRVSFTEHERTQDTPKREKEISKEPEPLHSEKEGDQLSLLQRGKGNIYLPNSAPSFESSPELRLSLQDASQVKKATLGGTHDLQREQRRISGLQNRIKLFDRKVIHL